MRVFVILPAAGIGTRMAAGGVATPAPKQFLSIGGGSMLIRSLGAFLAGPRGEEVCVAGWGGGRGGGGGGGLEGEVGGGRARGEGASVTAKSPRERIVHAQTRQGATFGLLRRAFIEAEADGFAGTDEASLLERAGIEVAVVPGSAKNFKITQPGDIELAEFYLGIGKA